MEGKLQFKLPPGPEKTSKEVNVVISFKGWLALYKAVKQAMRQGSKTIYLFLN